MFVKETEIDSIIYPLSHIHKLMFYKNDYYFSWLPKKKNYT